MRTAPAVAGSVWPAWKPCAMHAYLPTINEDPRRDCRCQTVLHVMATKLGMTTIE